MCKSLSNEWENITEKIGIESRTKKRKVYIIVWWSFNTEIQIDRLINNAASWCVHLVFDGKFGNKNCTNRIDVNPAGHLKSIESLVRNDQFELWSSESFGASFHFHFIVFDHLFWLIVYYFDSLILLVLVRHYRCVSV